MVSDQYRRFYLLTHPRSASNLLVRMLGLDQQPNVAKRWLNGYFFLDSFSTTDDMGVRSKHPKDWAPHERTKVRQSYQESFDQFEEFLVEAEKNNQIALVKEHSYFFLDPVHQSQFYFGAEGDSEPNWMLDMPEKYGANPTKSEGNNSLFSDQFLGTFKPIILIRHPALMFPSMFRAMMDIMKMENTPVDENAKKNFQLHFSLKSPRFFYDWYAKRLGKTGDAENQSETWPIVLDADDVINTPEVVTKLAELVGLDKESLRFSWEKSPLPSGDKHAERGKRMLSTVSESTGVIKGKAANGLDIDVEAKKWKEEFGEEDGSMIEGYVRRTMPDYEYLLEKRLRVV